ncbi:DNA-binding transcriptional LysR family regulator [Bradyrhizobium sp. USDA 3240]
METNQLSYFVLACQHRNHKETAARAGISSSALSDNLKSLERELGLILFERGQLGHYPTATARWLYQSIEPVLQRTEAVTAVPDRTNGQLDLLRITSPLQFMLGRLSRSASLAVRALRKDHPNVIAEVTFAFTELSSCLKDGTKSHADCQGDVFEDDKSDIVLKYAESEKDHAEHFLFDDDWIVVRPFDQREESEQVTGFDTLRRLPLIVPPLSKAQIHQVRAYCIRHDLPIPSVIEEDVGTFSKLSEDTEPFALLAPHSLVASGLSRVNFSQSRLPVRLTSTIIAKLLTDGPAARTYVTLLQKLLQNPDPFICYQPSITLKQMRYFLMLRSKLNMSAAAKQLNVVQPALSSQLRKLETLVGQPLFHRQHNGLKPTFDAPRLAELVEPAVERCDNVVFRARHIAAAQHHSLSIGVFPIANHTSQLAEALASTVRDWSHAYPKVKLKIVEAPSDVLYRWVRSGLTSFALVEAHISRSSQIDLQSEDLLGVVSGAGTNLVDPGEIPLLRVAELPLILPTETFGLRQLLNQAAEDADIRLKPTIESNSFTMTLALIRQTRFATIMPEASVRPYVAEGALQFNPIIDPFIRRRLSIVFSTDRTLTQIERSMIKTFRHHLAAIGFKPAGASDTVQDDVQGDQIAIR